MISDQEEFTRQTIIPHIPELLSHPTVAAITSPLAGNWRFDSVHSFQKRKRHLCFSFVLVNGMGAAISGTAKMSLDVRKKGIFSEVQVEEMK